MSGTLGTLAASSFEAAAAAAAEGYIGELGTDCAAVELDVSGPARVMLVLVLAPVLSLMLLRVEVL